MKVVMIQQLSLMVILKTMAQLCAENQSTYVAALIKFSEKQTTSRKQFGTVLYSKQSVIQYMFPIYSSAVNIISAMWL